MSFLRLLGVCCAVLSGSGVLLAFPPAPYVQVHGMVRDGFGWVLEADEGFVVVSSGGEEVVRGRIGFDPLRERAYELRLPVSSFAVEEGEEARSNTLDPNAVFTFTVELNGETYLPIEVAFGQEFTGNPGDIVEVDLTLGEDADRDGLPDDWEYYQLESAGIHPGNPLYDLETLSLEGDSDGDGKSNFQEFLGGTFAFDAADAFRLENVKLDHESGMIVFEVFVVFGKQYQLAASSDFSSERTIIPIHRTNQPGTPAQSLWTSNFTGFTKIYTPDDPEQTARFFWLRSF
jgi:hypothetical protein